MGMRGQERRKWMPRAKEPVGAVARSRITSGESRSPQDFLPPYILEKYWKSGRQGSLPKLSFYKVCVPHIKNCLIRATIFRTPTMCQTLLSMRDSKRKETLPEGSWEITGEEGDENNQTATARGGPYLRWTEGGAASQRRSTRHIPNTFPEAMLASSPIGRMRIRLGDLSRGDSHVEKGEKMGKVVWKIVVSSGSRKYGRWPDRRLPV